MFTKNSLICVHRDSRSKRISMISLGSEANPFPIQKNLEDIEIYIKIGIKMIRELNINGSNTL